MSSSTSRAVTQRNPDSKYKVRKKGKKEEKGKEEKEENNKSK